MNDSDNDSESKSEYEVGDGVVVGVDDDDDDDGEEEGPKRINGDEEMICDFMMGFDFDEREGNDRKGKGSEGSEMK